MENSRDISPEWLLNSSDKGLTLGWVCISIYCLLTAVSAVWVSESFSDLNGEAITFVTLFSAQASFFLCALYKREKIFLFIKRNTIFVMKSNVLTLLSWYLMFLALQKVEASVESAIYQGVIPVVVLLVSSRIGVGLNVKKTLGPILIFLFLCMLATTRVNLSSMQGEGTEEVLEGIVLAAIAGATAAIYIIVTAKAHKDSGASLLEVLATRFILLVITTAFLGYEEICHIILNEHWVMLKLILLSTFMVTLPVLFLQTAIKYLGGSRVSVITPLVPAVALATEYIISPWGNILVPILVVLVCFSVIMSNKWLEKTGR